MALDILYTSRNIGDVFYTLRKDSTLNGAVPCTGTEFDLADFSSSDGLESISSVILSSMVPVVSYADYANQVKTQGCCAYFAYDETTGRFKVPTIQNVYIRAGDSATLAKYLAPSIPNITGAWSTRGGDASASGAVAVSGSSSRANWDSGGANSSYNFDASRSSSVYKNGVDTVQPPSLILRPMVQLVASNSTSSQEEPEDPVTPTVDYRVPYIFVPGTEAKATEVNANFEYILRALKDLSGGSDAVHISGTETITGLKIFEKAPKVQGLEVNGGTVDFHYGELDVDYTARLFEAVRGYLAINQNPPSDDSSTKIATTNWVNSKVSNSSITGNIASWIKLPNGTIIQYGTRTGLGFWGGWSWSNFPTTFPNACRAVAVSWTYVQGAGNKGSTCGVQFNKSQIGVYPRFEQGAANLSYIAIGN